MKIVKSLNSMLRSIVDKDTALLVKVGILEDDLSVAKEKRGYVMGFLVRKYKSEIAAEIREMMDENEDNDAVKTSSKK